MAKPDFSLCVVYLATATSFIIFLTNLNYFVFRPTYSANDKFIHPSINPSTVCSIVSAELGEQF